VLVCLVALLSLLAGRLIGAMASTSDPNWPDGVVHVYDDSGMTDTIITAAHRWTVSGAKVDIEVVRDKQDADVIVRKDDRRLLALCGRDCLGYSTSIGHPKSGHSEVLLRSNLGGHPRPLSVWVAAHELGHVLGLRHRAGPECSLMSAHAFDTRCPPSLGATSATPAQLACVPAPADVEAAARLYGGAPGRESSRCR
jgi:predicted Zn-dependent protease